MTALCNPWCRTHYRTADGDPNDDPGLKKKRTTKGRGKGPKSRKDDDDDDTSHSGGGKKTRGLGMPGWVHSLLGTGEKVP